MTMKSSIQKQFRQSRFYMSWILIGAFLLAVVIGCGVVGRNATGKNDKNSSRASRQEDNSPDKCVQFNFRWLQTENVLYSEKVRHIEIFMDEKAFNEENMKTLFAYLSSVNPDPDYLIVQVHTNWAQLPATAPNCPGSGISEQPADPHEYDYLQATYWRRAEREYFKYSPQTKVDQSEFKTVIIRGPRRSD